MTHAQRTTPLAVLPVTTCEGCGICCSEVSAPPFLDDIDFVPPELLPEVLAAQAQEAERQAQGLPCIWWDPATRKCIHHEHRPNICREFEIGGECCLEIRQRFGIGS